jgi:hypothetical protein
MQQNSFFLLSTMIDITGTRRNAFNMHPPAVVFLLLFAFSGGSAFLAGYSMTAGGRSWFHMSALALAVTLTIYATLEIEYPREGFIRLTDTEKDSHRPAQFNELTACSSLDTKADDKQYPRHRECDGACNSNLACNDRISLCDIHLVS